jgi:hypothetical protein
MLRKYTLIERREEQEAVMMSRVDELRARNKIAILSESRDNEEFVSFARSRLEHVYKSSNWCFTMTASPY